MASRSAASLIGVPNRASITCCRRRISVFHSAREAASLALFGNCMTNTEQHFNALIDALAPQGKLALIDDPETLDVVPLKAKSLSLHWEFMFTRSMFETDDMIAQHQLLNRVAALIDNHTIKTTLGEHYGAITAANLQKAHRQRLADHARLYRPRDEHRGRAAWPAARTASRLGAASSAGGQR